MEGLAVAEVGSVVTFFAATFLLTGLARSLGRALLGRRSAGYTLLLDFCATLELCAALTELDTVLHRWGMPAMVLVFFLLLVAMETVLTWHPAGNSPTVALADWLAARHSLPHAIIRTLVMVLAGYLAWPISRLIWNFSLSELHVQRVAGGSHCHTELKTSALVGMLAECAATAGFELWSRLVAKYTKTDFQKYLNSFAVVAITLAGMHLTGMYFNPVLATSLTYGCEGVDTPAFFLVYWLGPTLGTLAVIVACGEIQSKDTKDKDL